MKSKVLRSIKINKKETETTTQIYSDKGSMTLKDVRNITQAIHAKGASEFDFFELSLIRILNGDRWGTWTSVDSYLEYYEGKVKDTEKFTNNVLQMQVTTYQSQRK